MELEIDPSGITLTNTYTNTNTVSIDSSNIDISGNHKITLNDTNGITVNNLTIQPTNSLGSSTNVTIDELSHLTAVTSNIQTQFNNIIDGAPGVLNTLNELATAINGDAAFATTITTSIDSKVSKTGDEDISGIKTIKGQFNYNTGSTISGDMIPESDDTHSLGSVTNRFKHLFVGNSSIWMGEDHKINATDGKLRFRKRKKTKVPRKVAAAGGSEIAALKYARSIGSSARNISDLKLKDWLEYGKTLDIDNRGNNINIEHIYEDGDSDFEEETTAENTTTTQTVNVLTSSLYPNPANHNITWIRGTGNLTDYEYAFIRNGHLPLSQYTWYEHESKANQLGGNLASIHSLEEQEFLVLTGNANGGGNYSAIIGIVPAHTWKNGQTWIGSSHEQWSDGTTFDYRNYKSGEPNDGYTSTEYIYWNHNYLNNGHWADEGSYSSESKHQNAIYKRPYHTQHTVTAAATNVGSGSIDISGDNLISINDSSGIVVNNLTITPEGSFDICGGNFTISVNELSKLDGISDNIQSQINTAIASGVWDQGVGKVYYNSGNVGIGTDNPTSKFEVNDGYISVRPGSEVNGLQFHSSGSHANNIEWYNSTPAKRVLIGSSADYATQFRFWENGSQNFIFLNDSNNTKVGINRTDPQYALDVTGDIRFSGNLYQGTSTTPFSSSSSLWTKDGANIYRSSGNVGIGTTTTYQNSKLHVNGDSVLQGQCKVAATGNNQAYQLIAGAGTSNSYLSTITQGIGWGTTPLALQHGGGNVGIGTTNPTEKLHVNGDIAAKYNGASIYLGPGADTNNSLRLHYISNNAYLDYNDTNNGLYMRAYTSGTGQGTALFLKNNAYVGVGKNDATERLDVDGNIKASGTITSGAGTLATETYVNTQVTNLIGGAPGALDTLNELAAAIGDDANYASSITTSLAGKVATTGDETISGNKTFSGDSEFNNINFTGTLTQNGTAFTSGGGSKWTESNGNIYRSSGSVGIGTTAPSYNIDVVGTSRFTDKMLIGTTLGNAPGKDWHNAHLYIGGVHNQEYNTSSTYKLVIAGSDNEATGNYPIYVIDENEIPLFYIQQQSSNLPNTYYRGKIGIGNSPFTPSKSLDVQGDINFTGNLYQNGSIFSGGSSSGGSSNWTTSNSNVYRSSGNVGIGTTNPNAMLHLRSSGDVVLKLEADTNNSGEGDNPLIHLLQDGSAREAKIGISSTNDIDYTGSLSNTLFFNTVSQIGTEGIQFATNSDAKMTILSTGNVGIGTTNPSCRLTIGSNATSDTGGTNSMAILAPGENADAILYLGTQHKNNHSSGYATGTGKAAIIAEGKSTYSRSNLHFCLNTAADNNVSASLSDSKMTILNEGNIGIGTTNPANVLDIDGGGGRDNLTSHRTGGSLYVTMLSQNDSNGVEFRHRNASQGIGFGHNTIYATGYNTDQHLNLKPRGSGNVGIGTITPTRKLDVAGDINFTGNLYQNGSLFSSGGSAWTESGGNVSRGSGFASVGLCFMSYGTTSLNGVYCGLSANGHGSMALWNNGHIRDNNSIYANNTHNTMKGAGLIIPGNSQPNQNSILFYTQPAGSVTAGNVSTGNLRMIIDPSGKVGIGNTNPSKTLDVAGDINFTGTLYQNGSAFSGGSSGVWSEETTWVESSSTKGVKIEGSSLMTPGTQSTEIFFLTSYEGGWAPSANTNPAVDQWYAAWNDNLTGISDTTATGFSLWADHSIKALRLYQPSDIRIKRDISMVDDNEALTIVNNIETMKYNYKDIRNMKQTKTYGFLAQNVREHLPNAVSLQTEYIPDITKHCYDCSWNQTESGKWKVTLAESIDISSNMTGNVKLFAYNISDISNSTFNENSIAELNVKIEDDNQSFILDKKHEHIFIFGREINDFHFLDKEQVFAVHHSAIQELSRKNDALTQEKETMQTQITSLLEENNSMKTRLEALEAAIINLQNS